jgi:hypothetical protein
LAVVNRLHGNTMIDGSGMAYQPPTVEDARRIETEHGARIASDVFSWPCADAETFYDRPEYFAEITRTQCVRVDGHEGEHRGEVTW